MKSRHPDKPFDDEQLEKDAFEVIAKFLQGRDSVQGVKLHGGHFACCRFFWNFMK